MTGLRVELYELVDDEDDLWYAFGFNKPSVPRRPRCQRTWSSPAAAPVLVFVDWDDARRAENYRVTITELATPPNELASQIVEESEHTFSGLAPGTNIRATVAARNTKVGESSPSVPAKGTVP